MEMKLESEVNEQGCFQWMFRAGRTMNERWAKSRNNLRERFHRKHPEQPPLQPRDLLNDTGTPDMHLVKVPVAMETSQAAIYKRRQGELGQDAESRVPTDVRNAQSEAGLGATRYTHTFEAMEHARLMHDLSKFLIPERFRKSEESVTEESGCGDSVQSVKDSKSCDMVNESDFCRDSVSLSSSAVSLAADSVIAYTLKRSVNPDYESESDCDQKDIGEDGGKI